jgi:glycosyltransferase involved in cell wall biosynthesis
LWYPIARDSPGGIETFLWLLVTRLEALGCQSTLLATGASSADRLVPVIPAGIRSMMAAGTATEYVFYEQTQLRMAVERAGEYDLIHSHIGAGGYVLSAIAPHVLHTQHSPVYQDLTRFANRHPEVWFSTVSHLQARKLGRTSRCHTIHNGIDLSSFTFSTARGEGLFFMGRMEAAKGPDLAIDVANALGLPLTLAGPIVDQPFFEESIRPRLGPSVRYVGVLDHREKNAWMARSACAVLPFRGEESFGLVMVEAMACGTPAVSLANGAAAEVIEPGVTGYLAGSADELAGAVLRAMDLDRQAVRDRAQTRFDIAEVAASYRRLYEDVVAATTDEGRGTSLTSALPGA